MRPESKRFLGAGHIGIVQIVDTYHKKCQYIPGCIVYTRGFCNNYPLDCMANKFFTRWGIGYLKEITPEVPEVHQR